MGFSTLRVHFVLMKRKSNGTRKRLFSKPRRNSVCKLNHETGETLGKVRLRF